MTESLDNLHENRKKLPLTAGTAIFVFACFLLVAGLCKFSFYVLKNHRSAVARDEFIQAYVDVQPFSAEKKPVSSPYIIFKDSTGNAPAFFYKQQTAEQTVAEAKPLPAPAFKRPPVIRPKPAPVPVENDANIPDADSLPISLDDLLIAGQSVLDASDKTVLDSQDLLTDDEAAVAEAAPPKAEFPAKPAVVAKAEPAAPPAAKKIEQPKQTAERWIDIAALREKIKKEQANESFMNGGAKTAVAAVHETDAVAEAKPKTALPAIAKAEPAKPAPSPFLTKEQLAEKAEFLPKSPWKVAKVGGKSANALAVKKEVSTPDKPRAEATTLRETAKIIYKNGRAKKVEQPVDSEKSLNWLDRKEAAVWTSLSQSDAPSVWTISDNRPAETAKAFRIAAEDAKPAENAKPAEESTSAEVSSAPVRSVGKTEKPEAVANPVLLPLGPAAGTPVSLPAPAAKTDVKPAQTPAPVIPAPSNSAGQAAPDAEKKADSSLVNKLFSIFNQPEESTLPTLGDDVKTPDEKPADAPAVEKDKTEAKTAQPQTAASKTDAAKEQEILPTEIRLTFKPNGTDISAQSVKWIKAFGLRVKKDIQRAIEVRMSNENLPLQEKRFAIIRSTLVGVGVDDAQIVPFMTNRSPHTIILRTFDVPEEGVTEYTTSLDGMKETLYYRKW